MEVYQWGEWPMCPHGSALTIGTFDGPHQGHVAIFDAVLRQSGLAKGVVTFAKPPAARFSPVELIVSLEKRLDFLQKKGFDYAIVIDFSAEFAIIEGGDFLRCLKERLGVRFLAEGEGFKMGAGGRCGTTEIAALAHTLDFTFQVVPPVLYGGERVSSSRVREALRGGDTALAAGLLGYSNGI
jgi:FAD synthase